MSDRPQVNQSTALEPGVAKHHLGMGWHFVCRYDLPIDDHSLGDEGIDCDWDEDGETSEGCIMYLADQFCRKVLGGMTAQEVYGLAYRDRDGDGFDDAWVRSEALRDAWAQYTVLPNRWTPTAVRRLFEDLEDVNYHSLLARLIKLVRERAPKLAEALSDWCQGVTP